MSNDLKKGRQAAARFGFLAAVVVGLLAAFAGQAAAMDCKKGCEAAKNKDVCEKACKKQNEKDKEKAAVKAMYKNVPKPQGGGGGSSPTAADNACRVGCMTAHGGAGPKEKACEDDCDKKANKVENTVKHDVTHPVETAEKVGKTVAKDAKVVGESVGGAAKIMAGDVKHNAGVVGHAVENDASKVGNTIKNLPETLKKIDDDAKMLANYMSDINNMSLAQGLCTIAMDTAGKAIDKANEKLNKWADKAKEKAGDDCTKAGRSKEHCAFIGKLIQTGMKAKECGEKVKSLKDSFAKSKAKTDTAGSFNNTHSGNLAKHKADRQAGKGNEKEDEEEDKAIKDAYKDVAKESAGACELPTGKDAAETMIKSLTKPCIELSEEVAWLGEHAADADKK